MKEGMGAGFITEATLVSGARVALEPRAHAHGVCGSRRDNKRGGGQRVHATSMASQRSSPGLRIRHCVCVCACACACVCACVCVPTDLSQIWGWRMGFSTVVLFPPPDVATRTAARPSAVPLPLLSAHRPSGRRSRDGPALDKISGATIECE